MTTNYDKSQELDKISKDKRRKEIKKMSKKNKHKKNKKINDKLKHKKMKRKYNDNYTNHSDSSISDNDYNNDMIQLERKKKEKIEKKKQIKKKSKLVKELFGYTNEENPFGDSNLTEKFIWKKRDEIYLENNNEINNNHIETNEIIQEIQKLRKRRDDRELERELWEKQKNDEIRKKDMENYENWAEKEEEFHLYQEKIRSQKRLKQGREKPIDLIAKNMLLYTLLFNNVNTKSNKNNYHKRDEKTRKEKEEEELLLKLDIEKRPPYQIFDHLNLNELEELHQDLIIYRNLDVKNENNYIFWSLLIELCENYMSIERANTKAIERNHDNTFNIHDGVHHAVNNDIQDIFKNKSSIELIQMEEEIMKKINIAKIDNQENNSMNGLDIDYWLSVLRHLKVYQTKIKIKNIHDNMITRISEDLKKTKEEIKKLKLKSDKKTNEDIGMEMSEYKNNSYLPITIDTSKDAVEMFEAEKEKGMDDSEEIFNEENEVEITSSNEIIKIINNDKYIPRKPRFFNRVKTGYDWNKYNQTHYDHSNPPPKLVQGYKFNLFYPDLIDKTVAPRFFLEKLPGNNNNNHNEFCIIRFHSGPPYHDIAFKIVNREWERSHKRGFKCVFERGILHLYFNFKRHRYRR